MSSQKLFVALIVGLLSSSVRAEIFHESSLDLPLLLSANEAAGCSAIDPQSLPLPWQNPADYEAFADRSAPFCDRFEAAFRILALLASEDEQARYQAVNFLDALTNSNSSRLAEILNSFSSPDAPHNYALQLSRRLTVLAVTDLLYIKDYAKKIAHPDLSIQNLSFNGGDLSQRTIEGRLCYANTFTDVNFTNASWKFDLVTRFCNFVRAKAPGIQVTGWLISQNYIDSDLQGSRFEFTGSSRSDVSFKNSDLRDAKLSGDLTQIRFIGSNLKGARLNGKVCTDEQGSGCLEPSSAQ